MRRRTVFKAFLALAGLPWLATRAQANMARRQLEIQQSPLAGFQYHGGERVWERLRVGDSLALVREPHNPYDEQAVALYWQGVKLGYVPRVENTAVAQMLDRGERLSATIVQLRESRDPWQRVQFRIFCEWG